MILKHKRYLKEKMTTRDYERCKSAITTANELKEKDSLRKIQMQLIATYGLDNNDVQYLLKLFAYSV